jgi:two-component system phosphate regulon sensor histidine kinase PhoR
LKAAIDPDMIEQALINLVDNAVKYSPGGSAVTIDAGIVDQEIRIRVRDQGIGIPQKHLPRLFERFYRVDKARSRKMGGTGLGLSIVKHIVQAHGGRVSVESIQGEGSTFTLHLPL